MEARVAADRVEVGIVFGPALEPLSSGDRSHQAVDRVVRLTKLGVGARYVVENTGVVGIDIECALPLSSRLVPPSWICFEMYDGLE